MAIPKTSMWNPENLKFGLNQGYKKIVKPVAKFFAPLGESLGEGIAAATGVNKKLEESNKKLIESGNKLLFLSLRTTDPVKKKSLLDQANQNYKMAGTSFGDVIPSIKKTGAQIAGEGAITALSILSGGQLTGTGLVSNALVNAGGKIAMAGKAKNATNMAKIAGSTLRGLKTFASGATWGTAMALESGKTKPKEVGRDAAIMGTFNLIAPPILGLGIKGLSKYTNTIAKISNNRVENAALYLRGVANKSKSKTGNWLLDSATRKTGTIKQTLAGYGAKAGDILTKDLDAQIIDRLYPILKNVNRDAYISARNYAGVPEGKFTIAKNDYDNVLKQYKGIEDEVLAYGKGMDLLTRLQKGQNVEGGATLRTINDQLRDIESRVQLKLGDDGLTKLRQGVGEINNFRRDKILKEYVDSGLVKKEIADKWIAENPNYTPHDVLDFVEDTGYKAFTGEGGKFNVLETGIKEAKGSERDLVNVYDADLHRLQQAQRIGERNRVTGEIINGVKENGLVGARQLSPNEKTNIVDLTKQGLGKVSYFNNGVREDWVVPLDLANAMKGLDSYQIPPWIKWLSYPQKVLRNFSTRFNVAFTLTNFPRDIQTAAGVNPNGLQKRYLTRALDDITNLNNPNTRSFFESGGAFGGLVSAEKPSRDILNASRRAPIFNSITNVGKFVESLGERFENATRYAVYLQEIDRGATTKEAAFAARNATVDFAKMGNLMAVMNQFIPFLNARTQGLVNLGSAITKDPTKFVRRQFTQAIYPTMLLYSYNNRFESYKNINPIDKQNYWIIMLGEQPGYDNQGNKIMVPNYIKIKKGEYGMVTSNIVEKYFDLSKQEDPQGLEKFLGEQILNLSPIDSGGFGTYTIPLELDSNYNFFTKLPIEPEYQEIVPGGKKYPRTDVPVELRKTRYTGETAQYLSEKFGKNLGLSPARIEFIVNKLFAGTGRDIMSLIDLPQEGLNKSKIPEANNAQIASQLPIIRTFLSTNASGEKIMLYDIVDRIKTEKIMPKEIEKELAAQMEYDKLVALNNAGKKDEANAIFAGFDKDTKDRIKRIKNNREQGKTIEMDVFERLTNNKEKVYLLIELINKLETREEKNKLYKDFNDAGLITKDILKGLKEAQKKGLLKSPTK